MTGEGYIYVYIGRGFEDAKTKKTETMAEKRRRKRNAQKEQKKAEKEKKVEEKKEEKKEEKEKKDLLERMRKMNHELMEAFPKDLGLKKIWDMNEEETNEFWKTSGAEDLFWREMRKDLGKMAGKESRKREGEDERRRRIEEVYGEDLNLCK